ncbi:MAG: hypothetical protein K2P21_04950 [Lachnospiraceae bacterium]|nr:hypothetical protein [Lachnospiraceae bacterium]
MYELSELPELILSKYQKPIKAEILVLTGFWLFEQDDYTVILLSEIVGDKDSEALGKPLYLSEDQPISLVCGADSR